MEGWVSIHRQIVNHWTYQEKRTFSKFEAWIDLILMANHKDTRFPLGNELIEAKRGEVITSEVKLMERWKWGKSKTRSFLELLEKDGMIVKKSDRKKTTITLINYGGFQDQQTTDRPQADREQTASGPQSDTINNANKKKGINKEIVYTDEFEKFWTAYPRKIEKVATFKVWEKLLKEKEDPELIIRCAKNYSTYCEIYATDIQFMKHPSTFLNKERYKEFVNPIVLQGGGNDPIGRIIKLYEKKIGPVGQSQKESLTLYCDTFTPEWVEQAIDINYKHNKRTREDILATLKGWKRSGQAEPWVYEEAIP